MGELRAELAERVLGAPPFRHVLNRTDVFELTLWVPGRMGDDV